MTGKPGRPRIVTEEVIARIAELRGQGLGYGRIARELGIGRTTVRKVLGKSGLKDGGLYPPKADGGPVG